MFKYFKQPKFFLIFTVGGIVDCQLLKIRILNLGHDCGNIWNKNMVTIIVQKEPFTIFSIKSLIRMFTSKDKIE